VHVRRKRRGACIGAPYCRVGRRLTLDGSLQPCARVGMSNGANALRGFLYQLYWSVERALRAAARVERPLRDEAEPDAHVRLVLEGPSDISEYIGSTVTHIQVKSRAGGEATWSLTALLKDVLLPFAQIGDHTRGECAFVFVTDAKFNQGCSQVAAFGRRLADCVSWDDDDEVWEETIASTAQDGPALEVMIEGELVQCVVGALPCEIASRQLHENLDTPAKVARLFASLEVVGGERGLALETRIRAELRERVPEERVSPAVRELLAVAFEYASRDAGTEFAATELLAAVGLAVGVYRKDILRVESARSLPIRIDSLVSKWEPDYARREHAHTAFAEFLASDRQIMPVVGPGRTGKTRLICELARECPRSIPVYLHKARGFRLAGVGHELCGLLGYEGDTRLATKELAARLGDQACESPAFIVFVDALDEADPAAVVPELDDLLELARTGLVKVVLTCRDSEWSRYTYAFATSRESMFAPCDQASTSERALDRSGVSYTQLGEFTAGELGEAFRRNIPTASVPMASHRDEPPERLRDLLRAPEMFSIFYSLSQSARRRLSTQGTVSQWEVTDAYWGDALGKRLAHLPIRASAVGRAVVDLAECIRANGDGEGAVSLSTVRDRDWARPLRVDDTNSQTGALAALVGCGMLEELLDGGERVRFAHGSVLDHALMLSLASTMPDEAADPQAADAWAQENLSKGPVRRLDKVLRALALLLQKEHAADHVDRARTITKQVVSRGAGPAVDFFFPYVGEAAVPYLREIMLALPAGGSKAPYLARNAASALSKIDSPQAVRALDAALGSDHKELRGLAARSMGKAVALDGGGMRSLLDSLADTDDDVRRAAWGGLSGAGPPALPTVVSGLSDPRPRVASACAGILGGIGHRGATPVVEEWLSRTEEPEMLGQLMTTAGSLGEQCFTPHLVKGLSHPDPEVRERAAHGLRGVATQEAREPLRALLADPEGQTAHILDQAVVGLGALGEHEAALDFCQRAEGQDTWPYGGLRSVRRAAELHVPESVGYLLRMLVMVGFDGSPRPARREVLRRLSLVETLEELDAFRQLRAEDATLWHDAEDVCLRVCSDAAAPGAADQGRGWEEVRFAATVLTQLGSERTWEALAAALDTGDHFVRRDMVEILGLVGGPESAGAIERVWGYDSGEWQMDRVDAAEALGYVGGPEAFPVLLQIMCEDDSPVQYAALQAIAQLLPEDRDMTALCGVLSDAAAGDDARLHAAYALGVCGAVGCAGVLLRIASAENEPAGLRSWCLKALGWMSVAEALPVADALIDDPDLGLAAIEVVCRLQSDDHLDRVVEALDDADDDDDRRAIAWCLAFLDTPRCSGALLARSRPEQVWDWVADQALAALRLRRDTRAIGVSIEIIDNDLSPSSMGGAQVEAVRVLADMAPHELLTRLTADALEEWYVELKVRALQALIHYQRDCSPDHLHPLVTDSDPCVRRHAARALARCVEAPDADGYLRELSETSPENARTVAQALLWQADPWASALLTELQEHDHGPVRWCARDVVAQRRRKASATALAESFAAAESGFDAYPCAKALEVVGAEDEVDTLLDGNAKRVPQLRALATETVKAIEKRLEDEVRELRREQR